jgi:hypothetical protein
MVQAGWFRLLLRSLLDFDLYRLINSSCSLFLPRYIILLYTVLTLSESIVRNTDYEKAFAFNLSSALQPQGPFVYEGRFTFTELFRNKLFLLVVSNILARTAGGMNHNCYFV